MVHDSGVSREKSRERGHGREDVGGWESIRGAFWESARATEGGIEVGGERRFACDIVAVSLAEVRMCKKENNCEMWLLWMWRRDTGAGA